MATEAKGVGQWATQLYVRAHVSQTARTKMEKRDFKLGIIQRCAEQIILRLKTTSDRTLVINYKQRIIHG